MKSNPPIPGTNARTLTIYPGEHHYDTRLGSITADRQLSPSVLEALVSELERQGCHPNTVLSATPTGGESGAFQFERTTSPR